MFYKAVHNKQAGPREQGTQGLTKAPQYWLPEQCICLCAPRWGLWETLLPQNRAWRMSGWRRDQGTGLDLGRRARAGGLACLFKSVSSVISGESLSPSVPQCPLETAGATGTELLAEGPDTVSPQGRLRRGREACLGIDWEASQVSG